MKIILAEDDSDLRNILAMLLRAVGYEVHEAEDGLEAERLQRSVHATLLITDMIMPKQDGVRTIQTFRQEFPAVRVLAISAGGTIRGMDTLEAARSAGADATCQKGVDLKILLEMISRLSERPLAGSRRVEGAPLLDPIAEPSLN